MIQNWEVLAQRSTFFKPEDFQQAAYQLMTQQVLYGTELRQKMAYQLIRAHLATYREVFDLFGVDIHDEPVEQYLVALPRTLRLSPLSTELTLLILTLAQIYHRQMTRGEVEGDQAVVTIEELHSAHRALCGRDLPDDVGSLRALLQQTQRMGMSRMKEPELGSAQPFDIAVRPAIKTLVNENILSRFGAAYNEAAAARGAGQGTDEDEVEGSTDEAA